MNKFDIKWILLGAAGYFLWKLNQNSAPSQVNGTSEPTIPVTQSFNPTYNSEFQFNAFQTRFGSNQASVMNPNSLFDGSIQSSVGYYTSRGLDSRQGFDILSIPT